MGGAAVLLVLPEGVPHLCYALLADCLHLCVCLGQSASMVLGPLMVWS